MENSALNWHLLRVLRPMKVILFIAKISGLFSFSLNGSTRLLDTTDKDKSVLYSLGYFSADFAVFIVAFLTSSRAEQDGSFYSFAKYSFYLACCGSTLLQVLMGFFVKYPLARWLNSLASCDVAMFRLGLKTEGGKIKRAFGLILTLTVIMCMVKMALFMVAFHKSWSASLCVAFYHIVKNVFKTVLVFCMILLHGRFEETNGAIRQFRLGPVYMPRPIRNDVNTPLRLERLCRLHFRLCHLAKRLNEIASFQLFYAFASSLMALLFFGYYLYHNIRSIVENGLGKSLQGVSIIVFGVVALIDEMIDCLMITLRCRLLCAAATETPKCLHKIRNESDNRDWDEQIKALSIQFLHQKLTFTALGYFDIDVGLLSTMAGTVITYLVLFIQYDRQSHAN